MNKLELAGKTFAVHTTDSVTIDESVFNKLPAVDKAIAFGMVNALGIPNIAFVSNFAEFTNYRDIMAKLTTFQDVSQALEFNGIELDPKYSELLDQLNKIIAPIEEKLKAFLPKYPFAVRPADYETHFKFSEGERSTISRTAASGKCYDYRMTKRQAELIWNKVAKFWATGLDKNRPANYYESVAGSERRICTNANQIEVGCQTVQRWELEYVAEHYGFTFPEIA